jgi:hypothetical protein
MAPGTGLPRGCTFTTRMEEVLRIMPSPCLTAGLAAPARSAVPDLVLFLSAETGTGPGTAAASGNKDPP